MMPHEKTMRLTRGSDEIGTATARKSASAVNYGDGPVVRPHAALWTARSLRLEAPARSIGS